MPSENNNDVHHCVRVTKTRTSHSLKSLDARRVSNLTFDFYPGAMDPCQQMPNVKELCYIPNKSKIPKSWSQIARWFPNVTTFQFICGRMEGFQQSFAENIPSLRHFIYRSEGYGENAREVANFLSANTQLTKLSMDWRFESGYEVPLAIEWHHMQNIVELNTEMYLNTKRIAEMKNLRKLSILGIHEELEDLDGFVIEGLEELESHEIDDKLIEFVMKQKSLKKLKIPFEENSKLLEMPRNLPNLNELCLSGVLSNLKENSLAANVIMEFMQTCDQLNFVVDSCNAEIIAERLESIQNVIIQKCDQGKWDVAKISRGNDYYYDLRIEKKQ